MKRTIVLLPIVLGLLFAAGALWLALPGQAPPQPKTIALVQLTDVDARTVAGFKAGLAEAGWREGKEVVYLDEGPAGSVDRLEPLIRAHLAKRPDLIMVSSTPATQAVKRLAADLAIPIVFAPVNDPLAAGIVTDLKRPGGMITGIRLPTRDDLRLEWLKRLAPKTRHVWVPYTPGDKSAETTLAQIAPAAERLGLRLSSQAVRDEAEIAAALAALPEGIDAIFLPRDSRVEAAIARFVATAMARRLPLCAPSLTQVEAGALMSYGFVHTEIGRQAARLALQIFAGVKPGDLPVEMAESQLSLNLATARKIGLALPEAIIEQAERIVRE
ncbi:MAG: ABC transporter substrate-binding protein [Rhodocyclaceae bacterium]|nr:ABC transporter substrate-binding protein [Rhodocyclaceae bacterium]